MPGVCDLSKRKPIMGNNVSHSNNRTRKKFHLNLQKKRFEILGKVFYINVSVRESRTLLKYEGCIIRYMINMNSLSEKALKIKRYIKAHLTDEQFNSYKKERNFNPKVKELKKQPKPRILKKKNKQTSEKETSEA